jgi:hypothetical protein
MPLLPPNIARDDHAENLDPLALPSKIDNGAVSGLPIQVIATLREESLN